MDYSDLVHTSLLRSYCLFKLVFRVIERDRLAIYSDEHRGRRDHARVRHSPISRNNVDIIRAAQFLELSSEGAQLTTELH